MKPSPSERKDATAALVLLKERYLERYNRWPGSHFTAAATTEPLALPAEKVGSPADGEFEWVLSDAKRLPRVLAGMLNSKVTGSVQLPEDTTYDEVSTMLRTHILPVPKITGVGDAAGAAIQWNQELHKVIVYATPEQLYFSGVSIRQRIGATGNQLTVTELQDRLLSIEVRHVCNNFQLAEVNVYVRNCETMLSRAKDEDDICENKQRAWWLSQDGKPADHWHNDEENVLECISNHFKKYLLEMYTLDVEGHIRTSTLTLGVDDNSCSRVGVPVTESLDTLKPKLHRAIAEVFSRVFPSPPARCEVDIVPLDTAELETKMFQTPTGQVVVITKPGKVSLAYKTGWVLAVVANDGDGPRNGAIFSGSDNVAFDDATGTLKIAGQTLRSEEDDFRLYDATKVSVQIHVVVTVVTRAKDSPALPSRALFTAGSFQLSAKFNGRFMHLSPFCAWAWVRHRAHPQGAWEFIGRPRTTTVVAMYDETAGNLEDTPLANQHTSNHIEVSQHPELVVVTYCLGVDYSDLLKVDRCTVALLDVDPGRLQKAARYAVERTDVDVVDIRLLTSWADLAHDEKREVLPPAVSDPGIKRTKEFLLGIRPLPQEQEYLVRGSRARNDEHFLITKLRPFLACSGLTIRTVHVVLRGTGTTTLLQRVAMALGSRTCVADETREEGAGEAIAAIRETSKPGCVCKSFVVLLVTSNWNKSHVAKELQTLQKSRPELPVVLLVALVHDVGDVTVPWSDAKETILNPVLTATEVGDFVDLYSHFFPHATNALAELKGKSTIAGLPALTVTGGHHAPSLAALAQLLESVRSNTEEIDYLAQLAVLELFAAVPEAKVRGPAFTEDWRWLLTEPTTRTHRLSAVIWAIPLLQLTAHLAVSVDPSQPGGFDVKAVKSEANYRPKPLHELLTAAMQRLVTGGLDLNVLLRKAPFGQAENRMPRWIQVVGETESCKVLYQLTRKFPYEIGDGLKEELLKSWTQACILRMQLLMPSSSGLVDHWKSAVAEACVTMPRTPCALGSRVQTEPGCWGWSLP